MRLTTHRLEIAWDENSHIIPIHQFPFSIVDKNLGWTEPDEAEGEPSSANLEASAAFLEVLLWLLGTDAQSGNARPIALRVIAACLLVAPATLNEQNQASLAARFAVSKQAISKCMAELRELLRVEGYSARSLQSRQHMSDAMTKSHRRRKRRGPRKATA